MFWGCAACSDFAGGVLVSAIYRPWFLRGERFPLTLVYLICEILALLRKFLLCHRYSALRASVAVVQFYLVADRVKRKYYNRSFLYRDQI